MRKIYYEFVSAKSQIWLYVAYYKGLAKSTRPIASINPNFNPNHNIQSNT